MPEMTGVELAAAIRAVEVEGQRLKVEGGGPSTLNLEPSTRPPLPLILTSSVGGREAAGDTTVFVTYLAKPIRPSALFDALMTVLAQQPQRAARGPAERPRAGANLGVEHPLRILLVEDNVVNQKLALRLLAQMDYRADVAANGLEAIQAVERQPYDVILMDVQMPEMDGLEATRQICARWPAGRRPAHHRHDGERHAGGPGAVPGGGHGRLPLQAHPGGGAGGCAGAHIVSRDISRRAKRSNPSRMKGIASSGPPPSSQRPRATTQEV